MKNENWTYSEYAARDSTMPAPVKIVGWIKIASCNRASILHFAFFILHFAFLTLQCAALMTLDLKQKASRNTGCGWLIFNQTSRNLRDVHEAVDVRDNSVIPNEARTFKPPEVPRLTLLRSVFVGVEGEVHFFHAAVRFNNTHDLICVLFSIWRKDVSHHKLHQLLLIFAEVTNVDAWSSLPILPEFDRASTFTRRATGDSLLSSKTAIARFV